uniref:Vascular cell adhesion protein 1 n=1 Tax=Fundulus heteroclitus TaxID=8078 RepID=A0A3Q2QAQ9_FUNHE
MFSCSVFLGISLLNILRCLHVSACDVNCADKPVLTPSALVVKYGDPASATCVACQKACLSHSDNVIAMEKSVGNTTKNGTTLTWTVDRLTEWALAPKCFYSTVDNQCCTHLSVIVYQPPENVSISLNHTGPLTEHTEYTLQCSVLNVAPARNLVVTFYRGQTKLGQEKATSDSKEPVNERFALSFNASKEDNGAQFWCEAKLELGAYGPQPPPVVKSDNLTATVHYGPKLKVPANPAPIDIPEGETLNLTCLADGNPNPLYNWSLPSKTGNHSEPILTIKSVDSQDAGQYVCTVRNSVSTAQVTFNVNVKVDFTIYIIVAVILAVIVIAAVAAVFYFFYYKQNKMGEYQLKDVFRLGTRHQLIPQSS